MNARESEGEVVYHGLRPQRQGMGQSDRYCACINRRREYLTWNIEGYGREGLLGRSESKPKWWSAISRPNIGFWSTNVGACEEADADCQCKLEIVGETQQSASDTLNSRTRVRVRKEM